MFLNQHDVVVYVLIFDVVVATMGLLLIIITGLIDDRRDRAEREQTEFPDVMVPSPREGEQD